MKSDFKAALDNCEREPVHIPGLVQPFAALVAFEAESFRVTQFTRTAIPFTNVTNLDTSLVGHDIGDLFAGRELIHSIRGALGLPTIRRQRERLGMFPLNNRMTDIAIHLVGNEVVMELEEYTGTIERTGTSISRVRAMLGSLKTDQGMRPLLESAVRALRHLTGYDRVMGYQFLSDGSGEVVAEEAAPGLVPFLGLRYPAFDIPPQVRRIALKSPIRVIHNIEAPPVKVIAPVENPLDMTLCHSRAVSEIHIEYLRNMGICSTMNLSIIVHGELWGLFAFHHEFPKLLSPDYRAIAELFGHLFSMQLQQEIEKQNLSRRRAADAISTRLRHVKEQEAIEPVLQYLSADLMDVVGAQGMALRHHDEIFTFGNCPQKNAIEAIGEWTNQELLVVEAISSISALSIIEASEWNHCGGFMSIMIDDEFSQLIFFRNEIAHEIRWGGMPEKKIDYGPNGPRLHPRSSFDEYKEKVGGRCEPWSQEDLSTFTEIRAALLTLLYRDMLTSSDAWLKQKQYQDLLIAELNHRVKNILALVRSIARQTLENASNLDDYAASFEERITALVAAHDLVGGSGVQWVRFRQLLQTELSAYMNSDRSVDVDGVSVALRSDIAPVLALVIHEMTSNAAKYGALAGPGGTLQISWKTEKGGLGILWREECAAPIRTPGPPGFGLTLINRAVSHECQGETTVTFNERGIDIYFWLPGETFDLIAMDDLPIAAPVATDTVGTAEFKIESVLLLEDNLILAMEMERILTDMNCEKVHTTATLEEATEHVETSKLNLAIIDININGTPSFQLAHLLKQRQIPFLFVTGYGNRFPFPEELVSTPRLLKPVDVQLLNHTISSLIRSHS